MEQQQKEEEEVNKEEEKGRGRGRTERDRKRERGGDKWKPDLPPAEEPTLNTRRQTVSGERSDRGRGERSRRRSRLHQDRCMQLLILPLKPKKEKKRKKSMYLKVSQDLKTKE